MEKYIFPTLMLLAQAVVLLIGLLKAKNDKGKYKYNPNPPGEAATCQKHDVLLQEHGEALARLEAHADTQEKRLDRIEGKLNGK